MQPISVLALLEANRGRKALGATNTSMLIMDSLTFLSTQRVCKNRHSPGITATRPAISASNAKIRQCLVFKKKKHDCSRWLYPIKLEGNVLRNVGWLVLLNKDPPVLQVDLVGEICWLCGEL